MGVLLTFLQDTKQSFKPRTGSGESDLFGNKVFETKIPENVKLSEAQESSKSVFDHDPKCSGARSLWEFS